MIATEFNLDQYSTHVYDFNSEYFYSRIDIVLEKKLKMEEEIIFKVLEQLLNRKITIEDAKYTSKIKHIDFPNEYILAYKNYQLGKIKKFQHGFLFSVSFYPNDTKFLNN